MRILICCIVFLTTLNCQNKKYIELEKDDFTITYPSELELYDGDYQDDIVLAIKTKKEGDKDIFIENINLAKKEIKNTSYENFIQETIKEINSIGDLIKSESSMGKNNEYHRIIFKLSQNGVNLKFTQDYHLKGRVVYILTFSSEQGQFDNYYNEMDKIMKSFKIK